MSVHGIFYTDQHDDTKVLTAMNNWGNCWGAFQNIQNGNTPDHVVDIHVLVRMDERYKKYVEPFMNSQFFKELTDGKYSLAQMNPAEFNGKRLMAHEMRPENYIEVVFKSDLAAARAITASRFLTSFRLMHHIPGGNLNFVEEHYHLLPLAINALGMDGSAYSDAYVSFVPITKAQLLEEADGDELYDVDVDDGFFRIAQLHHNSAQISVEMLKRILARNTDDFQAHTSQTWSLLDREYFKDCEADDWIKDEDLDGDTYISVGSPVQDVMRDGETRIANRLDLLLAQLA